MEKGVDFECKASDFGIARDFYRFSDADMNRWVLISRRVLLGFYMDLPKRKICETVRYGLFCDRQALVRASTSYG